MQFEAISTSIDHAEDICVSVANMQPDAISTPMSGAKDD
jgi:hypothetical protein